MRLHACQRQADAGRHVTPTSLPHEEEREAEQYEPGELAGAPRDHRRHEEEREHPCESTPRRRSTIHAPCDIRRCDDHPEVEDEPQHPSRPVGEPCERDEEGEGPGRLPHLICVWPGPVDAALHREHGRSIVRVAAGAQHACARPEGDEVVGTRARGIGQHNELAAEQREHEHQDRPRRDRPSTHGA